MIDTIRELMSQYNTYRTNWVGFFGTDEGFDAWFTTQVAPKTVTISGEESVNYGDPRQDVDAAMSEITFEDC